jgi:N-acetylneuraminate synthase
MANQRVYVIAEIGVNHNGSLALARQLVEAAAATGVDAVKFQIFSADELVATHAPKARYQLSTTDPHESQAGMLQRLALSAAQFSELHAYCAEIGVEFLASPFDPASVDFLARLGVSRLKLGSGEITNAQLLLAAARTGLPVILSTGMCSLGDVEAALGVLAFGYLASGAAAGADAFRAAYESDAGRQLLAQRVTLLHCTTEYPAPLEDVNLRAMDALRAAFGLPVGYSDHTEGIAVPIAAVARGATMIEKHVTLDRTLPGPDHRASLEPADLARLVAGIRAVEQALGTGGKYSTKSERGNREIARRSLVAARDIVQGEVFSAANLAVRRPADGIPAMEYFDWLGRTALKNYLKDEPILP